MTTLRDGRVLHVVGSPTGGTVVVAESGMADGHEVWAAVAAALPADVGFVRYDRAGLGGSTADPAPRTARRMAADLVELVETLPGEVVLLGHSIGGPVCRVAAAALGPRVRALVLLDPTDETTAGYYSPEMAQTLEQTLRDLPEQARDGRLAARARARLGQDPPSAPRVDGALAEYRAFVAGLAELRDDPPTPPAVPVLVLSATGRGARAELRAAHVRYAGSLPSGIHRDVPESGHDVHLQCPGLVAAVIRTFL